MKNMFNDKGFWKTLFKLSIPVILQNLLTSSFTLADTLLVSSLGTVALSSVGMMGQWAFLINMILVGFCSGTTVFVSQYWGIKDMRKIRHISGISISFSLGLSVIFTAISLIFPTAVVRLFNSDINVLQTGAAYLRLVAFSYIPIALTNILAAILRSVENVKLPMYVSVFTTVTNIFLDYSMIFGKFGFSQMGVRGAALATTISAWLGLVLVIAISIMQKNLLVKASREFFAFDRDELKLYIKKSTPVIINEGMWGAGTFIFNIIFGNMGYEYFSALTIVRSFENIAFVIFIGISSAASVMLGKSIGKGNIDMGLKDSKRFMVVVPLLAVVTSVFIVIFRSELISIFNMENNLTVLALHTSEILMLIYAAVFPLRMLPFIEVVAIFRSGGDTVTGAKYELASLWLVSIPATLIAVYVFKVPFVVAYAIMYICEDVPKNIMCMKLYLSKKWIKPVTKEGQKGLESYINSKVGDNVE